MTIRDWDLRHFRLLHSLATHGSIGAAGRDLGMAQPNASRLLDGMERSAGVPLAIRTPSGTRLTDAGTVLAGLARDVLTAQEKLVTAAEAMSSQATPLLIAASQTVAEHLMPLWLARAQTEMPESSISLWVGNSDAVYDKVAAGEVDLGFIEGPVTRTGFRFHSITRDDLVLVAPPTHPWSRQAPSAEDVLTGRIIVREPGSGTRQIADQALAALAAAQGTSGTETPEGPELVAVGSNAALINSASAGLGPGVVSWRAVRTQVEGGLLCVIPTPWLNLARTLRAVWLPQPQPSPAARAFLALTTAD